MPLQQLQHHPHDPHLHIELGPLSFLRVLVQHVQGHHQHVLGRAPIFAGSVGGAAGLLQGVCGPPICCGPLAPALQQRLLGV